jgi:hypothetical protein
MYLPYLTGMDTKVLVTQELVPLHMCTGSLSDLSALVDMHLGAKHR